MQLFIFFDENNLMFLPKEHTKIMNYYLDEGLFN